MEPQLSNNTHAYESVIVQRRETRFHILISAAIQMQMKPRCMSAYVADTLSTFNPPWRKVACSL